MGSGSMVLCLLCALVQVQGDHSWAPVTVHSTNATCTVTAGILDATWCVMGELSPCSMSYKFLSYSRRNGELLVLPGKPSYLSEMVMCFTIYHPVPTDLGVIDLHIKPCKERCILPCTPTTAISWSSLFNGDVQRLLYEDRQGCIVKVVCMNVVAVCFVAFVLWRFGTRREGTNSHSAYCVHPNKKQQ
ncbi:Ba187 [Baboon cytomegalovirus]|nr:Ba187 [Baboon cytomegalovirus]